MKANIFPAIKLTFFFLVLLVGFYTLLTWGAALTFAPNKGKGETINYVNSDGALRYGFENIGQSFTEDKYFWSRPSAVGYNAAGSGASNKGPTNEEYLSTVLARIDTFMRHNPGVKKSNIPVELVTASGSGLDPHISPKAALIQAARIARDRNISEDKIIALINANTEEPLFGLFGPSKINVLKLNIGLNSVK